MTKSHLNIAIATLISITAACLNGCSSDSDFFSLPSFSANNQSSAGMTPSKLDRLWGKYFYSQEKAPIKTIVEFINQDDFTMVMGYEFVNRNNICEQMQNQQFKTDFERKEMLKSTCGKPAYKGIIDAVKAKYPNDYENQMHLIITEAAAIWSLEANRHQYKKVDEYAKEIIATNPQKLDYRARIKQALNKTNPRY